MTQPTSHDVDDEIANADADADSDADKELKAVEAPSVPSMQGMYVPTDLSELSLADVNEAANLMDRRRRVQILIAEQEAEAAHSKLLGQMLQSKIDTTKKPVESLEASDALKRAMLANREHDNAAIDGELAATVAANASLDTSSLSLGEGDLPEDYAAQAQSAAPPGIEPPAIPSLGLSLEEADLRPAPPPVPPTPPPALPRVSPGEVLSLSLEDLEQPVPMQRGPLTTPPPSASLPARPSAAHSLSDLEEALSLALEDDDAPHPGLPQKSTGPSGRDAPLAHQAVPPPPPSTGAPARTKQDLLSAPLMQAPNLSASRSSSQFPGSPATPKSSGPGSMPFPSPTPLRKDNGLTPSRSQKGTDSNEELPEAEWQGPALNLNSLRAQSAPAPMEEDDAHEPSDSLQAFLRLPPKVEAGPTPQPPPRLSLELAEDEPEVPSDASIHDGPRPTPELPSLSQFAVPEKLSVPLAHKLPSRGAERPGQEGPPAAPATSNFLGADYDGPSPKGARLPASKGTGSVPAPSSERADPSPDLSAIMEVSLDESPEGPAPLLELPPMPQNRYKGRASLGAGGQGVVTEVVDRFLARPVALKVMRKELGNSPQAIHLFWREAQITGQLAHSGIVPIYDIGLLPDLSPYYTMRRIRGRTLRTILRKLRSREKDASQGPDVDEGSEPEQYAWARPIEPSDSPEPGTPDPRDGDRKPTLRLVTGWERAFTRRRLLEILVSACHTIGYAHDRGVIHRDLKPGNIMIGDYGEVLVLDWGIAKVLGQAAEHITEGPVQLEDPGLDLSRQGVIKGTPAYMAPEQANGDIAAQGPFTDVYALGLILYEILVGLPARGPGASEEIMRAAREGAFERPETRRTQQANPTEPIAEQLEQICLKCLEREQRMRYPSAESLAEALQAYLTGEQRREIAEMKARDAEAKVSQLEEIDEEISVLEEEVAALLKGTQPWMDISKKRRLWAREDRLTETRNRREETLASAMELFTQALGEDADNRRARRGLCRLLFDQLVDAEYWGRVRDSRRLGAELKRYDDGSMKGALLGTGSIELTTDPSGAQVWAYDLRRRDRRLQPADGRLLGNTPLSCHIQMGTYLLEVKLSESSRVPVVKYPVRIRRQEKWEGHVRHYPNTPQDFVFVPASRFTMGGDREAPGAGPREEVWVDDFMISRFPVTCAEYLEFLNALERSNPKEAARRVPRLSGRGGGEPLWAHSPASGYRIPGVDPVGGRWSPEIAVHCVSREDAVVYCLWKSSKIHLPIRLPTEFEWEKAGRGTDARIFPWGDEFDASFCNMKDSLSGAPELMPVGTFEADCSPYCVRDMAGGVIEWCAGAFNRDGVLGIQKGGFWLASQANCRLARRFGVFPMEPEKFGGFRVAYTPEK